MCWLWNWIKNNNEPIKIVFAIATASFVWFEYSGRQTDARVQRTMEFQSKFSQPEIQKVYLDLNFFMIEHDHEFKAAGKGASIAILKAVQLYSKEREVFSLAEFYGQVVTCLERNLCELKTACAVFSAKASALHNNFYELFAEWEKDWNENFIEHTYTYFSTKCPKIEAVTPASATDVAATAWPIGVACVP